LSDEASVITVLWIIGLSSLGTNNALFEPIHGSYPQAKGKYKPSCHLLSAAMLLEHFGLHEAKKIYDGVEIAIDMEW
jgi:3-isopropylmalate dehydrogenase